MVFMVAYCMMDGETIPPVLEVPPIPSDTVKEDPLESAVEKIAQDAEEGVLLEAGEVFEGKEAPRGVMCNKKVYRAGEMVECGSFAVKGYSKCFKHLSGKKKEEMRAQENIQLRNYGAKLSRAARKDRKHLYSMDEEMAFLKSVFRVLSGELKTKMGGTKPGEAVNLGTEVAAILAKLQRTVEAMTKLSERIFKMEMEERNRMDAAGVNALVGKVIAAVQKRVKDPEVLAGLVNDLMEVAQ